MQVFQSPLFTKKVKKFSKKQKNELDKQIKNLLVNPLFGEEKKGDLKGIFVYKFKISNAQYLFSYRLKENNIELITIGPHENYYRDLKTYLKS
ncbi:type II toxin-antitoxin system RelE/ParE family toxin [candidate division KSB1 bacterium]|nr:type II toxin-antitoxin system RelE/ParE family toxin [candidate division KSB1 bacterium]